MSDEMSNGKIIEVGGVQGVDVDSGRGLRRMFAADPQGTLGWLRAPFQEAAAVFRFDASTMSWVLRNKEITFLTAGEGEACPEAGFLGTQPEDATSLLRGGYPTSDAYFALQGMALQMAALGYTPKTVDVGAGGVLLVNRDGVGRSDTLRLAPVFADTLFRALLVESYQQSRKCFATLGKAKTFLAETLVETKEGTTELRAALPVAFKRVLIIPPGCDNNLPEYAIRLRTSRDVSIPSDKDYSAPDDGAFVVFTVHAEFAGYCSDEGGTPLVTTTDNAEAVQANTFVGFAPKAP